MWSRAYANCLRGAEQDRTMGGVLASPLSSATTPWINTIAIVMAQRIINQFRQHKKDDEPSHSHVCHDVSKARRHAC